MTRRKTSTELKLHGTFRKDRHVKPEPDPVGKLDKPTLDANGSWFWDQHIAQVTANGAGGGDLAMFRSACEWWSIYRALHAEAKKPKSDYRIFVKLSMAWKNCNTAMAKLGLSPVERAKLRIQAPQKPSKKSRFFG